MFVKGRVGMSKSSWVFLSPRGGGIDGYSRMWQWRALGIARDEPLRPKDNNDAWGEVTHGENFSLGIGGG